MTKEDKKLLLRDLCARLSYGVKGTVEIEVSTGEYSVESGHLLFIEKEIDVELVGINKDTEEIDVCPLNDNVDLSEYDYTIYDFIPYLRPMSNMTEEEKVELRKNAIAISYNYKDEIIGLQHNTFEQMNVCCNWLNSHHFDYRGLIEKGLALEAPEGMYNNHE